MKEAAGAESAVCRWLVQNCKTTNKVCCDFTTNPHKEGLCAVKKVLVDLLSSI